MRIRIWKNLANIRFKAFYTSECAHLSYHAGNIISFILAFASASSVAAWVMWDKFPWLWAGIVAFSQLLHVAKPYLPYVKNERDYIEMSFEYEYLYMKYEKLWHEYEKKYLDDRQTEEQFYQLRNKEIEIESNHKLVYCPEIKWIMNKAENKTITALKLNFCL
jgi:hypothetical protein